MDWENEDRNKIEEWKDTNPEQEEWAKNPVQSNEWKKQVFACLLAEMKISETKLWAIPNCE